MYSMCFHPDAVTAPGTLVGALSSETVPLFMGADRRLQTEIKLNFTKRNRDYIVVTTSSTPGGMLVLPDPDHEGVLAFYEAARLGGHADANENIEAVFTFKEGGSPPWKVVFNTAANRVLRADGVWVESPSASQVSLAFMSAALNGQGPYVTTSSSSALTKEDFMEALASGKIGIADTSVRPTLAPNAPNNSGPFRNGSAT